MDETNINTEDPIVTDEDVSKEVGDKIEAKVKDVVEKLRTQSMLLGARAMTVTIANMIDAEMNKPGKRTMADMKRIVKKVRKFCQKAIDHPVEEPKFGEEETAQN
jgi:hypothetical protein|nr:MAG TPA_asm: hypothetical protein [Caudoviricetes sp.]